MTRRLSWLALVLTVTVVAVSAVAPQAVGSVSGTPAAVFDAQSAAKLLTFVDGHRGRFGGYTVDVLTHTIRVRVTGDISQDPRVWVSEQTSSDYLGSPQLDGSWEIQVQAAQHSLAELDSVAASVPTAEPFASASRGALTSWDVDQTTGRVAIGVTDLSAAISQAAQTSSSCTRKRTRYAPVE